MHRRHPLKEPQPHDGPPRKETHLEPLSYWFIAFMLPLTLQDFWQGVREVQPVAYSEFEQALADGRIAEAQMADRTLTGQLKTAENGMTLLLTNRVETDRAVKWSCAAAWMQTSASWPMNRPGIELPPRSWTVGR